MQFGKEKKTADVQYDFVVKPNANPNQIEWEIEGAESVEIDSKGDLLSKLNSARSNSKSHLHIKKKQTD